MLLPNPYSLHNEAYLNLRYQYQSTTEIFYSTVVERQQSQSEARRPISAFPMRSFTISALTLSHDDVAQLTRFFEVQRGKLSSFRFRDLTNFRLTARPVVSDYDSRTGQATWSQGILVREPDQVGNSGRVYQYCCTRTIDGSISCVRKPIYKLASVPQVFNLSTLASVSPSSVDYNTGIITLPVSPSNIGVNVDFDTPVRFDDDKLTFDVTSTNAGSTIAANNLLPSLAPPGFAPIAPAGYLSQDVANRVRLSDLKLIEIIPPTLP
jgi:uncharacterized protein (TIGR02217 family)